MCVCVCVCVGPVCCPSSVPGSICTATLTTAHTCSALYWHTLGTQHSLGHTAPSQQATLYMDVLCVFVGEYIKNWRPRWFVLRADGAFHGYKAKPPPGEYKDPLNNFRIEGL